MRDLSQSGNLTLATHAPQGSAQGVYRRLMGYSWHYKGRLIISIVLAILIAASFGTMLVSMGAVVKLTFYDPAALGKDGKPRIDPAQDYARNILEFNQTLHNAIGWAPDGLDTWLLIKVRHMREDKMRALFAACMLVLVLALVIGIARYAQEYLAGAIGANISADLGEEMYENLMQQSVGFFEANSSGDILARFTNDVFMVNRGLSGVFVKLMREPFKALTFLVIAISVDPWLTLVALAVLPPVAYALSRLGKSMRRSVRRSLQNIASMASVVNETVVGIFIVKGFNMEAYEISRVKKEITKLRKYLKKMVKADAATGPITEFLLIVGVIVFVLMSGQRVMSGKLAPGDLISLYLALAMMMDPVRKLSSVNNLIQTSVASAERVFEFIDLKPGIVEAPDAVDIPPMQHLLRLDNVRFSYDGKTEVLRGISVDIRKGEMVALVGFSGAGKSTFVKLIPRFYDVSSGAISIDGVNLRHATFKSIRDMISIVTQDTILFAESIRNNIAFGQQEYPDARVKAAAQAANADEFIQRLPQKYDTVIGESGSSLSGGQRQRLAIARAIIKDPAILILDEATSSLDSESERLIQQAFDEFITGRTTIVIAHRLSTIQRADRILVMEDGQIVEQGTHRELLDHDGIYRRLYDTQFGVHEAAR